MKLSASKFNEKNVLGNSKKKFFSQMSAVRTDVRAYMDATPLPIPISAPILISVPILISAPILIKYVSNRVRIKRGLLLLQFLLLLVTVHVYIYC